MKIDFNTVLTVGAYKQSYSLAEHYPQIPENQNICVFVSGGMESTLIAKTCLELYGKDRTVLVYSDNLFSEDKSTQKIIEHNAMNVEKILEHKVEYIPTNKSAHKRNALENVKNIRQYIINRYNSQYGMLGFTELFWTIEPFKQPGVTTEYVKKYINTKKEKFINLIEEFHFFTESYVKHIVGIDIHPDTWIMLRDKEQYGLLSPVKDLNKHAIIDIYCQLGWWNLLLKTRSCVDMDREETGMHCGQCFNCQQRHDGFDILGIKDPTKYANNDIIEKRKALVLAKELYKSEK